MPRKTGDNELPDAKRGALLALSNNTNWSDRKIAGEQRCSKSTVQNVRKRALENEKENIDPYSDLSPHPRKGRPPVISERDAHVQPLQ